MRDTAIFILNISLGCCGGWSQARIFSIPLLDLRCFYRNACWKNSKILSNECNLLS
ncbi:Uncharacterized protein APZ42_009849 [Daphnia magna]|uniref:Uncharacterized protein n=1 Tax=Daphnia magna TaxID=35525 RepID=A0A164DRD2_9CRUS|nr:Uncharacterized protein APZ42_009849 [Daphnia magna]